MTHSLLVSEKDPFSATDLDLGGAALGGESKDSATKDAQTRNVDASAGADGNSRLSSIAMGKTVVNHNMIQECAGPTLEWKTGSK